jgi:hypothetical protein
VTEVAEEHGLTTFLQKEEPVENLEQLSRRLMYARFKLYQPPQSPRIVDNNIRAEDGLPVIGQSSKKRDDGPSTLGI